MDFGIVTAKVDEIGYIAHAENLGYTHCWVTDSQMIRSNCWAVLALAARETRRMRLGTGVNVPGLRLAPAAANGIATINRLAPGRCFISLGTGHTAMRMLGQRPMRLQPFREYVRVVRALLDGEEVDYTLDGETHRIRFQMREHRFIDLEPRIPLYIAGFGPKAQALAGEMADGLVSGLPRGGTVPAMLANARTGAARAGRALPAGFHTAAMATLAMRQPGEAPDAERIVSECGAAVLTGLHYLVARHLETGEDPPEYARPVWNGYMKWLEAAPPERRHQRLHGSHYSFIDPEEAPFITADLIKATCLTGVPEEIAEQVQALEQQGLSQIMLYPPLNRQYRVIEDFAERVMSRL
ncbi:MAG TPA: LLM class flavin-dependent oxidoreductase [Candidatus Limnocylindrales bacterium]|nr:LLM class flavin-dependent oxidoreductase [Candidatus Limnocylindrales bacterium]